LITDRNYYKQELENLRANFINDDNIKHHISAILDFEKILIDNHSRFSKPFSENVLWETWSDSNGKLVYSSPAGYLITGYLRSDMQNDMNLLLENIYPEDRELFRNHLFKAFTKKENAEIEFRFICKNGNIKWIKHNCTPLFDANNIFLGTWGINRDITILKKLEYESFDQKIRYNAILATVQDIIVEFDKEMLITYVNKAGYSFFGNDIIGKPLSIYNKNLISHNSFELLFKGREEPVYYELWHKRVDGANRLLAWWSRPLYNEKGEMTGIISTARDITELKKADEIVIYYSQYLQELINTKDELLRITAHDLKNPLKIIHGFSKLGEEKFESLSDEEKLDFFKDIRDAAEMMLRTMSDLIDVNSLDENKVSVNVEQFSIPYFVKILIQDHFHHADSKNIQIKLTDQSIITDFQKIRQVMNNLISNAIKFSSFNKNVYLSATKQYYKPLEALCFRFEVRDEGPGISETEIPLLFERFVKLTNQPTNNEGGTGLGLTIVRELVRLMKGKIEVSSEIDKGTTFSVYLPEAIEGDVVFDY
jgi:PAS domain S-box-containing protein